MRAAVLLALLIGTGTFPVAAQVPDDQLVIPGQRIGKWMLQMTLEELTSMNGRPLFVSANMLDIMRPLRGYYWTRDQALFFAWTADGRTVAFLGITGGQFRTERGVGYKSPVSDVEGAYGRPTAVTRETGVLTKMIYDEIGLAVSIASELGNPLVFWLSVFPKGKARELWRF
jgi:hypothetical protein